jgi:small conductance mechanosensitive channel
MRDNSRLELPMKTANTIEGSSLFVFDSDSMEVIFSPGSNCEGSTPEDLYIDPAIIRDGFNGTFTYTNDDTLHYASVEEFSDYTIMSVVPEWRLSEYLPFILAGLMCVWSFACLAVLMALMLPKASGEGGEESPASAGAEETCEIAAEAVPAEKADSSGAGQPRVRRRGKTSEDFEKRWHMSRPSWEELSPEKRLLRTLGILFSVIIVICAAVLSFGHNSLPKNTLLLYLLEGDWNKSFNRFSLTYCIIVACAIVLALRVAHYLLYQIARFTDSRGETICFLLRSLCSYAAVIAAVYYCMAQFGVNTQTMLLSAGALSLAISLASKELVGDILAGIFIIADDSLSVGDKVEIDKWQGTVTEVGIHSVKIENNGEVKIISNANIKNIIRKERPSQDRKKEGGEE